MGSTILCCQGSGAEGGTVVAERVLSKVMVYSKLRVLVCSRKFVAVNSCYV